MISSQTTPASPAGRPAGQLRSWTIACTVLAALLSMHPAAAQNGANTSLRQQALALYPAEEISSPDAAGRYQRPKGAASLPARQARRLLTQAAGAGDKAADLPLGLMLEVGAGGPQDFAGARRVYARSDDRVALWHLGLLLIDGKGGPRDLPRARLVFKRAADAGLIDASYEYARMVELGLGGPRNAPEARKIYESTLEWCHGDIADRLSMMLMRGLGGAVDHARAAEMQLKAIDCNNRHFEKPVILARPGTLDRRTVEEVQKLLKSKHGYGGPVSGRLDPRTRQALRKL